MTVELISVGTEILLGNIVNTNAAYLAEKCASLGLACYYQSTVGDNEERLQAAIEQAVNRSDIVILSGGLGPTQDDLTKEVTAKVFNKALVEDEHSKQRIKEYFDKLGKEIPDNNWKQAMIPMGAIVIDNDNGTAPGIIVEAEDTHVILLPGPPGELVPMFERNIVPYIQKFMPGIIYSQTVKICGIGESKVESVIRDLIEVQTNPTIAPYAKTGEVHLRVTAKAEDEKTAKKLIKPVIKELKSRFDEYIYSAENDATLEKVVVDLLKANKLTVSCAESCTGGMLSARLINVAGVSEVYKSGYITYSNKAKHKILGVKKTLLDKYGAVSKEVAKAMAEGAAEAAKADVAVSITGIAGPDGGTKDKPVGLVYIACHVKGKTVAEEYHFTGNRSKVRESSVAAALCLMRKCILEYYNKVTFGK